MSNCVSFYITNSIFCLYAPIIQSETFKARTPPKFPSFHFTKKKKKAVNKCPFSHFLEPPTIYNYMQQVNEKSNSEDIQDKSGNYSEIISLTSLINIYWAIIP